MGGFGEEVALGLMEQLIDVLTYLSNKSIVHRDLKLENILVTNELHLKVADFGYATKQDVTCLKTYTGSSMYMAPEIEEGKEYDGFQVDIFSTGVILFILVTGKEPFD